MGRTKRLIIWAGIVILNLACTASSLLQLLPANVLTTPTAREELPFSTPTRVPFPTLAPQPTSTPPYPTAAAIPAWVTDFADPILKAVKSRRPDFQDSFSRHNQGWFIRNPQNSRRPFYADVHDEALYLQLPTAIERKDLIVYNDKWAHKNFVLSFDFKFGKTEPDDILRFQFGRTLEETVALDLSKNESWIFYWNLHNNLESSTGTYDYFSPEYLNVTVIMRANECAVYLNNDPVDYSDHCRTEPIGRLSQLSMTFHLLSDGSLIPKLTGQPVLVIIDNVKVWDLDNFPELP